MIIGVFQQQVYIVGQDDAPCAAQFNGCFQDSIQEIIWCSSRNIMLDGFDSYYDPGLFGGILKACRPSGFYTGSEELHSYYNGWFNAWGSNHPCGDDP
jgi:hypothetical protein